MLTIKWEFRCVQQVHHVWISYLHFTQEHRAVLLGWETENQAMMGFDLLLYATHVFRPFVIVFFLYGMEASTAIHASHQPIMASTR